MVLTVILMIYFIEVLPAIKFATQSYTYSTECNLFIGMFVLIPFGKQVLPGIVTNTDSKHTSKYTIKNIITVIPIPPLNKAMIKLITFTASYNMISIGSVLKMVLHSDIKSYIKEKNCQDYKTENVGNIQSHCTLSKKQTEAVDQIIQLSSEHNTILLDGVTGSGKTAVYCTAIQNILKQEPNAQFMILLPEIILVPQLVQHILQTLGIIPVEWHSSVTKKHKREIWYSVATGKIKIIIGARSALFLPFKNLKLIIIDEEHDSSYKQEESSSYNARDLSIMRGFIEKIPVILASATPAIETIHNVNIGKFRHIQLTERFGSSILPEVSLIDMKHKKSKLWISKELYTALNTRLHNKEQSALFLNRRGYAPITLCKECGYKIQCIKCNISLTEHREKNCKYLMCHYCNYKIKIPTECATCFAANSLIPCGPGVERIEEEIKKQIPNARIVTITSDNSISEIHTKITDIIDNKYDIIIGTQLIAKGHNFDNLTLVGIIDADLALNGGDLRAAEKTYQVLVQMSGRAGRSIKKGQVLLQTYHPNHQLIKAIATYDRALFYQSELISRQQSDMPPFTKLGALIFSGKSDAKVAQIARAFVANAHKNDLVTVMGPCKAPISPLRGFHRHRILISAQKYGHIQQYIQNTLNQLEIPRNIKLKIDIDPYSFM